jgi:hypothetical protein
VSGRALLRGRFAIEITDFHVERTRAENRDPHGRSNTCLSREAGRRPFREGALLLRTIAANWGRPNGVFAWDHVDIDALRLLVAGAGGMGSRRSYARCARISAKCATASPT